jgi:ribosome-associated toxin RatA of RatAB toxin-antitoxin module
MTVEYVTVDRPRRVAIKMVSRSALFQRFAGSWLFESRGPERTHVLFRYGFETRWPVRTIVNRLIATRLGSDIRQRLEGLKRGAEDPALVSRLRASV